METKNPEDFIDRIQNLKFDEKDINKMYYGAEIFYSLNLVLAFLIGAITFVTIYWNLKFIFMEIFILIFSAYLAFIDDTFHPYYSSTNNRRLVSHRRYSSSLYSLIFPILKNVIFL